jgi:general secretion pathway protein M
VSLRERLERLEDRERRLLGIAVAVAVLGAFLVPPVALFAVVHSRRAEVEDIRAAARDIMDNQAVIERARFERDAMTERYARPAPALQAFLSMLASEAGVEIPESQDRQAVPRGKRFEERSTKVTLRKVGMLKLVNFLERIETSGYPVKITQLDLRKRSTEPDSYDVDMVVSAFDRKAEPKQASGADGGGAAPGSAAVSAQKAPGEAE